MKSRIFVAALAVVTLLVGHALRAADDKGPGKDVKCPVSGKEVKADQTVDFNGGKVYFCCPNCPKAFSADSTKFAAKANLQLVQTKQLTQVACPFTGKELNPETVVEVAGVKVCFCCNNCKGKVTKLAGDEQIQCVFGDISKGFKAAKK